MMPLSIVMPTKSRQRQCRASVRAILSHYTQDFELIVYDSSLTDELRSTFSDLNDVRLRYVHDPRAKNMTECFEAALQLARRDYICMIGDDDGLTPFLFKWLERAAQQNLTSVVTAPANFIQYNWPGVRSPYFGSAAGEKLLLRYDGAIESREGDAKDELPSFLNSAGQGCGTLPRVYHGLVAQSVLDGIRRSSGAYFTGVSPDVSFSYLAGLHSPRHAIVAEPLTIGGTSSVSNAGRSMMNEHRGDLWTDPHMKHYGGEAWPDDVPEFFSVETVWGQATLSAIDRAGAHPRDAFNFSRFYALLILGHPDRAADVWRALRARPRSERAMVLAALGRVSVEKALHFLARAKRKFAGDRSFTELRAATISDATRIVDDFARRCECAS